MTSSEKVAWLRAEFGRVIAENPRDPLIGSMMAAARLARPLLRRQLAPFLQTLEDPQQCDDALRLLAGAALVCLSDDIDEPELGELREHARLRILAALGMADEEGRPEAPAP